MVSRIKTINLALQGGGSHAALTWGILDKLLEDGRVKFDSIAATSVGAMNAVVLAHGLATGGNEGARTALYQLWKMISNAGQLYGPVKVSPLEKLFGIPPESSMSFLFFDLMNKTFSPYQLNPFDFNPLKQILETIVDFDIVKKLPDLNLFISATNVKTGKIKVFDKKEISSDAIMAAACLPFMFQAVKIGDDYLWDGGYMGNPPLFPLIDHANSEDILIIHINPLYREEIPESATDILNRINEISFNASLMSEMRIIAFRDKLLREDWLKKEHKNHLKHLFIHAIHADIAAQPFPVASKLNSEWLYINQLFEEGRREGETWLKNNYSKLGKCSSIDITEYL